MSFRLKLLTWIVAINLGITGLLLIAVLRNIQAQSLGFRQNVQQIDRQREEIIRRLEDILRFQEQMSQKELAKVSPATIIQWDEWTNYRDAMVLLNYTLLDNKIVDEEHLINPLGRRHRSFNDENAREILETAIAEDRMVLREDERNPESFYIAIPIHLDPKINPQEWVSRLEEEGKGRVWGGALVQPRFPQFQSPEDYFSWVLFWAAMAGGTLILILVTYIILSRMVIHPVERMALAADSVARGDFSIQFPPAVSRDEIGRLISSFNYMVREVRDYHQHLEERVREAQDRVQAAEKHLLIAQRLAATGKLAAGIAHEINNPIGGMINAALNLKEKVIPGGKDSRARVYLELITEGLERIKDIVRKVLVFTPRSLTPSEVSLRDMLNDTEALLAYRLKEKEVELTILVEPEDLMVFCEPGELRHVILNLIINALDAVELGQGIITVTGRSMTDGQNICVEIKDNGCGMDPEELNRAFDLFYTTKEAGKGTGLGLSVAHNIVVNHGGLIEVESTKDEGTTIRVLLPAR